MWKAFEPLVVVERNGHHESVHHGALVVLDENGSVAFAIGDPSVEVFGRSAWKPFQAAVMVDAGLRVPSDQLAVVAGSHSGRREHQSLVLAVLASAGLDETSLRNAPEAPFAAGRTEVSRIAANCSGKHAGMLATSVARGWSTDEYLSSNHPVQLAIVSRAAELGAGSARFAGADGCGAPAIISSLVELAHAMRSIATGASNGYAAVRDAMLMHPELVAGPGRYATMVMTARPGVLAKDGAEGVITLGSASGRALAMKIADGNTRAWGPILSTLLAADIRDAAMPSMRVDRLLEAAAAAGPLI